MQRISALLFSFLIRVTVSLLHQFDGISFCNCLFDPNRIFTPAGRIANVKLNKSYDKVIEHEVQQFAKFILNEIPPDKTIIAVHNNTEGRYTINKHKKGNKLEKNAELIYQNSELDEDDFF